MVLAPGLVQISVSRQNKSTRREDTLPQERDNTLRDGCFCPFSLRRVKPLTLEKRNLGRYNGKVSLNALVFGMNRLNRNRFEARFRRSNPQTYNPQYNQ